MTGRKKSVTRKKSGGRRATTEKSQSQMTKRSPIKERPMLDINTVAGAKLFEDFLPDGWTSTYDGRMFQAFKSPREKFHAVKITLPNGKFVRLQILEHPTFIELEGIFSDNKGAGSGTTVMEALKNYTDSKGKGIMVRDVSNEKFFNQLTWLKRVPDPLTDYGANYNYVYNVSGDVAEPLEIMEDWS